MFSWEGMGGFCANTPVLNKGLEYMGFGTFRVEFSSLSQSPMDEE